MASYKPNEESLKSEIAIVTPESTPPGQLIDNMRAKVVDVQENLSARDAVVRSVVVGSSVLLGQSLWGLVENFHAGSKNAMGEAFRAGSFDSQFLPILPSIASLSVFRAVLRP